MRRSTVMTITENQSLAQGINSETKMPKGFYKDPVNLTDLDKNATALKDVDLRVARQSSLGERDINAICPMQIPNDSIHHRRKCKRSILTKPDSTYEEVQREEVTDELQHSEFVKLFEDIIQRNV